LIRGLLIRGLLIRGLLIQAICRDKYLLAYVEHSVEQGVM
jgi:hypothetical protein